jgi:hypothetical protein
VHELQCEDTSHHAVCTHLAGQASARSHLLYLSAL